MQQKYVVYYVLALSVLCTQSVWGISDQRTTWREAKDIFETAFNAAYKTEISDKNLSNEKKSELGLDKGKGRKKYIKFNAKLGPRLDTWDNAKKSYDKAYEEYRALNWTSLHAKDKKTALELAKATYVDQEFDTYLKIKDKNSSTMSFKKLKKLMQAAYHADNINFGDKINKIWHDCGGRGDCGSGTDSELESLREALDEAISGMDIMMSEAAYGISFGSINKTTKFKKLLKSQTDAAEKVEASCGVYETRIQQMKSAIEVSAIKNALDELEAQRHNVCSQVN